MQTFSSLGFVFIYFVACFYIPDTDVMIFIERRTRTMD